MQTNHEKRVETIARAIQAYFYANIGHWKRLEPHDIQPIQRFFGPAEHAIKADPLTCEAEELREETAGYRNSYHRIMGLLQATKGEHGLCQPRHRKACSSCTAQETIDYLLGEYKGAPIIRSEEK